MTFHFQTTSLPFNSTTLSICYIDTNFIDFILPSFFLPQQICYSADIVIEIPGNLGQDDSSYRLDYYPPFGNPLPNTTIASKDVGDEIRFSNVLAGTKYNFWLYYTNSTHHNLLAWTVSITTGKLFLNIFGQFTSEYIKMRINEI